VATLLFTDIVGSTERAAELGDARWRDLVQRHHALVRQQLVSFRGRELDTAGDGFFASFDGPARAVRCASAIIAAVPELGIDARVGLQTVSASSSTERWEASPCTSVRVSPPRPHRGKRSFRAPLRTWSPGRGSRSRIGASTN
jgi:class 3 adenylate cyclase